LDFFFPFTRLIFLFNFTFQSNIKFIFILVLILNLLIAFFKLFCIIEIMFSISSFNIWMIKN
jgi:hypothetical protein